MTDGERTVMAPTPSTGSRSSAPPHGVFSRGCDALPAPAPSVITGSAHIVPAEVGGLADEQRSAAPGPVPSADLRGSGGEAWRDRDLAATPARPGRAGGGRGARVHRRLARWQPRG